MLRITPVTLPAGQPCLFLEGRLLGPWVHELAGTVAAASDSPAGLQLDLTGVHYVDAQGLALLRSLQGRGAVLRAVSPFVAELLHERPT